MSAHTTVIDRSVRHAPPASSRACMGGDPALWVDEHESDYDAKGNFSAKAYNERVASMRSVCATCPAKDWCIEDAIITFEEYAIRGGFVLWQRRERADARKYVMGLQAARKGKTA